MTIGERVKQLRKDKSLSQKELAEYLSIDQSTLACYETNKRQISNELFIKLAKFFDVSLDELFGLEDL